jgi:hypothetical protein
MAWYARRRAASISERTSSNLRAGASVVDRGRAVTTSCFSTLVSDFLCGFVIGQPRSWLEPARPGDARQVSRRSRRRLDRSVATKVKGSADRLFGQSGDVHLAYHNIFTEGAGDNQLRAGYIAIVLATAEQLKSRSSR